MLAKKSRHAAPNLKRSTLDYLVKTRGGKEENEIPDTRGRERRPAKRPAFLVRGRWRNCTIEDFSEGQPSALGRMK